MRALISERNTTNFSAMGTTFQIGVPGGFQFSADEPVVQQEGFGTKGR